MDPTREMVCIVCPIGCRLRVSAEGEKVTVTGNTCARGVKYGEQELLNPMRMVTTSVWAQGGEMPLVSVKTQHAVPKAAIGSVLEALTRVTVAAPVEVGEVILSDVAGTGVDVVATRPLRSPGV